MSLSSTHKKEIKNLFNRTLQECLTDRKSLLEAIKYKEGFIKCADDGTFKVYTKFLPGELQKALKEINEENGSFKFKEEMLQGDLEKFEKYNVIENFEGLSKLSCIAISAACAQAQNRTNEPYSKKINPNDNFELLKDIRAYIEELPKQAKDVFKEGKILFDQRALSHLIENDGLKLLEKTLNHQTKNSKALENILQAISVGSLTVNGQQPDKDYPLGEYLIHGGRVNFDVSALSKKEKKEFFNFISNGQAKPRFAATHREGGTDAYGRPAEVKSGIRGAVADLFNYAVRRYKHYGINLAIGGNENNTVGSLKNLGKLPQEDGRWGHLYLHRGNNLMMAGIESSAPGKTNARSGESHGITGKSDKISSFCEEKIYSKALQEEQKAEGKAPLSTASKYNWACVEISKENLNQLRTLQRNFDTTELVNKVPQNAIEVKDVDNRIKSMEKWARKTKKKGKVISRLNATSRGFGAISMVSGLAAIALATVGTLAMVLPTLGVSQAVGIGFLSAAGGMLGVSALSGVAATGFWAGQKIHDRKVISKREPEILEEQADLLNEESNESSHKILKGLGGAGKDNSTVNDNKIELGLKNNDASSKPKDAQKNHDDELEISSSFSP